MEESHFMTASQVLEALDVKVARGLDDQAVVKSRSKHGPNEMEPPEPTPFWKLVLKQFEDMLVLILLGAAIVSFILGLLESPEDRISAMIEPAVILIILVLNAAVGVVQETNAENAIERLKEMEASEAKVLRNGRVHTISPVDLVPGDIVLVSNGDKVPADLRLVELTTASISVDESSLTGEGLPVEKSLEPIVKPTNNGGAVVDQDKRNMLFSSSLVTKGRATGVVVLTGSHTSIGRIQHSLQEEVDLKTPLQEKLDEFGAQLSKVILVICLVVWLINIGHFTDPEHGSVIKGAIYYFKIAVALAVAAIPEGLPAVVTTCLALGTKKMADKNAIVRSLPSVETLGCTTVICSDKTGTLTTNKMSVVKAMHVSVSQGKVSLEEYSFSGDSWSPKGTVTSASTGKVITKPAFSAGVLNAMAKIGTLCNESYLNQHQDDAGIVSFTKTGESTEAALKVFSEKCGVPEAQDESMVKNQDQCRAVHDFWNKQYARSFVLEFDRDRKSMGVIVDTQNDKKARQLLVKGAPESVLHRCISVVNGDGSVSSLNDATRSAVNDRMMEYANQGLRCIAFAYSENPKFKDEQYRNPDEYSKIESNLIFVGIAAMMDPPRAEVLQSIRICHKAGIRVVVITGDNKSTAIAICRQIGVFSSKQDVKDCAYTGSEFSAMSETMQTEAVLRASLFARVEPSHKSRLVELLQKQGHVVAMTGDGVNDAPALKKADIGVAMGSGTAVAKDASDLVLQDDNFATIVSAVEEGRAIYANTKQFIRYLVSSNIGEVACIFLTAAIGMPEALIPVQLLWVNLVTDGLPATALGFNKPDKDIMSRPPRGRSEKIINGWMFCRYMIIGLYVGLATCGGFIWWYLFYGNGPQISFQQLTNFHSCHSNPTLFAGVDCGIFRDARPSTVSLSILVAVEMLNTFNALSENQSLATVVPWSNPFVVIAILLSFALHSMILYVPFFHSIFHVAPLSIAEWIGVWYWSVPIILIDECLKFITRRVSTTPPSVKSKAKKDM
uniref:Calcium-transporting ATPase n=1 Tax=Spongospora subterranea TaxID=70186 RepID=A0A0H5R788_9EUKA|eukprot:CRZ10010.1 hypothetical protein [Spongospora subterranea]